MAKYETNKITSIGQLLDFDWKLKLALESNTVSQLNAPIVELTLDSIISHHRPATDGEQGADSNRSSCQVEMDCQSLDKLIGSIHAALAAASSSSSAPITTKKEPSEQ